jgi:hypothetical protein
VVAKRYVGTKRNVLYQKELVAEINLLKLLLHMLNFQSMTMTKHQELFKRHVIYLDQYNLPSTPNFHVPIFENQFGGGSLINHSSLASINNFISLVQIIFVYPRHDNTSCQVKVKFSYPFCPRVFARLFRVRCFRDFCVCVLLEYGQPTTE